MFIDSDYNTKGFDGQWGDDVEYMNHPGWLGGILPMGGNTPYNCPSNKTLKDFINKYDIKPSRAEFKKEGVPGCSTLLGMVKCMPSFLVGCYGNKSKVTSAFDKEAKKKNSYDYTMQEMIDGLANAQNEVDTLVPYNSNMNCAEYDAAISALNTAQINWNGAAVTHLYDRDLRAAYLAAISASISTITSYMDARDCQGATSAIDTSQQAAADAVAAQAAAQAAADAATAKAAADAAAAAAKAKSDVQAAEDAKKAEIDLINEQVALEKAETEKRNKMLLFGAAVIIAILIIRK